MCALVNKGQYRYCSAPVKLSARNYGLIIRVPVIHVPVMVNIVI